MAISIQDDAPLTPQTGDLWWESDAGKLKIYYDDGDSKQWVDAFPAGSPSINSINQIGNVDALNAAPGEVLVYDGSKWVNTTIQVSQGGGGGGANLPFEDFVSANLGNRKPLIWDFAPPTGVGKSDKAAGIRGAHFLDLSTSDIYEKTGDNNDTDWLQIAYLGQPRDYAAGEDYYVQFNSGDRLAGVPNYIYNYDLGITSGASGKFDEFYAQNVYISGDLYVTGKTHVTEVLDYTVQGDISGKEFYADNVYIKNDLDEYVDIDDAFYYLSGRTVSTFGLLQNDIYELDNNLDSLSGRSVASFGKLLGDIYEIDNNFDNFSGRTLATFGQILDQQYGIESGLENLSGRSVASIAALSNSLDALSGAVSNGTIGAATSDLINVSGEALANFIALSDDLQQLSDSIVDGSIGAAADDLITVSGESLANFISLSDDISLLKDEIKTVSTPLVYDKLNLPVTIEDGTLALVTDGSTTNTQVMAYHYNGSWYRTTDNSQIT